MGSWMVKSFDKDQNKVSTLCKSVMAWLQNVCADRMALGLCGAVERKEAWR